MAQMNGICRFNSTSSICHCGTLIHYFITTMQHYCSERTHGPVSTRHPPVLTLNAVCSRSCTNIIQLPWFWQEFRLPGTKAALRQVKVPLYSEADRALSLAQGAYADMVTFLPETRFYTQITIRALCSLEVPSQLTCSYPPGLKVTMAPCLHRMLNGV